MPAKNKILRLINKLPEEDFRRFKLFLQSPYFNTNDRLVLLLQARGMAEKDLEMIHQLLFPTHLFNRQVFKNWLSKLMQLYKKFLAVSYIEKDPLLLNLLARETVPNKEKEVLLPISKLIGTQGNPAKSILSLQLIEQLLEENIDALFAQKTPPDLLTTRIEEKSVLQLEIQTLKLLQTFILYLQAKQKMLAFSEINHLEIGIKQFIFPQALQNSTLIILYYKAFLLLREPTKENYEQLKELLNLNLDQLHVSHIQYLDKLLENHCISAINRGATGYQEELFHLMETRLDLVKGKPIKDSLINNYVKIACRISKAQEAGVFVEANKQYISYNAYTYTKALIEFYKKEYEQCLEILLNVTFTNLDYQLTVRQLTITSLFLLEFYEAALNHISSFRIFLIRKKEINSFTKRNTLNYLKFLKSFLLLKDKASYLNHREYKTQILLLKKQVISCKQIVNKTFLIDIIKEELG